MAKSSWKNLAFPLLFFVMAVIFFTPVLAHFSEAVVGWHNADVLAMFYPVRSFANGEMQHWRLPLWNPYVLCGQPFLEEGQGSIFYPLTVLLAWLPAAQSMNLFALLHFALAGLFFYFYLRACGLLRFSAFFGAFVYMFSSGPISRLFAGHFTIIPFLALAPALLWAWQSWCNRGGWGKAGWGAICVGCMVLAGYPQLLLYAGMYLGWLALVEVVARWRRTPNRSALTPLSFYIVMMILGACVGGIQLLPSYAFAKESFRQQVSYDFISSFSFAPENLITLLMPRFFGPMGAGVVPYWGRNYLWEMWIYIGIFPLALAIAAIFAERSRRMASHATAAVLFMILALGSHTPLHRFLYDYVPFFNYFRGSSKFSFYALISLCALAAFGADHLLREMDPRKLRRIRWVAGGALAAFALGGILLLIIFGLGHNSYAGALGQFVEWRRSFQEDSLPPDPLNLAQVWSQTSAELIRLAAFSLLGLAAIYLWPLARKKYAWACIVLAVVVSPDLLQFCAEEFPRAPVTQQQQLELSPQDAIPPKFALELRNDPEKGRVIAPDFDRNALVRYDVPTSLGYVGNMTTRYNNFLTSTAGAERSYSMVGTPFNGLNSQELWPAVYYLMVNSRAKLPPQLATKLDSADVPKMGTEVLYRLNNVHPRVSFSKNWQFVPSLDELVTAVENKQANITAADYIETENAAPLAFDKPGPGDEAHIAKDLPEQIDIATRAAGPRLLVLADSYASGWRCVLDGKENLPIYPVNMAFRGVVVPAGEHQVRFAYAPNSFYAGSMLSALSLLGIAIGALFLRLRPRKPTKARETKGQVQPEQIRQPMHGEMGKRRKR